MNQKGQIALEYLLIFFIFLIIVSTISIPFLYDSIESTNDMTTSIKTKSLLTELHANVDIIYSLDADSMRTISLYVPSNLTLYHTLRNERNYLYTTLTLSDGSKKKIEQQVPCKVTFNNNATHYYSSLKNRWYYNTEVKWVVSASGEKSININFK